MLKTLFGVAAIGALVTLSGCDTTTAIVPYTPSTPNVLAFQTSLRTNGATVQVGDFSAAAGVSKPSCRLAGSLDVTAGKPYQQYIKDALQTELFTAGVYDVNSPLKIGGVVDDVRVNTFGTGSWTLGLKVTSTRDPVGYHVSAVHQFESSYSAVSACKNATAAFAPTVQELLAKVVGDPGFARLVGRTQAFEAAPPPIALVGRAGADASSRSAPLVVEAGSPPSAQATQARPAPVDYELHPYAPSLRPSSASDQPGRVTELRVLSNGQVQQLSDGSPG